MLYRDRHGLGAPGGLAWGKSRYNGLYRGLGRPLCRNRGSDTATACCDKAGQARHAAQHTAERGTTIRPMQACDTAMIRPGTGATRPRGRLRHDATRPAQRTVLVG